MTRPRPTRQQGFGLVIFVVLTAVLAFSLVVGFASVMTRQQANTLAKRQAQYLAETRDRLAGFYEQHAIALDNPALTVSDALSEVLVAHDCDDEALANAERQGCLVATAAGVSLPTRHGLRIALSSVLTVGDGATTLSHRRLALWLPSAADAGSPVDLDAFEASGAFPACTTETLPEDCAERRLLEFDSLDVERRLFDETRRRLEEVAFKAQAYFKARMLQDPERNISVNYFRTLGTCSVNPPGLDLPCTGGNYGFEPLGSNLGGVIELGLLAQRLMLAPNEVVTAWGGLIEVSNETDPTVYGTEPGAEREPPYTLVFRAPTPSGAYIVIRAIQPI